MSDNKHLTLDERNFIEQELFKNTKFMEIAKFLSKYSSPISREVRKHRIRKVGQVIHVNFNHCDKKYNCHKHNFFKSHCLKKCGHYNNCNDICSGFVNCTCLRLNHAHYVCNGYSENLVVN